LRPLEKITTAESPRFILESDFSSLNGKLPIYGGWGYSKEDACVLDKNDPTVDASVPFDGVELEYVFVQYRTYEEMIVTRNGDERFSGIGFNLVKQTLLHEGGRTYDKLDFEITAFADKDWEELKAEYQGPNGYGSPNFNLETHEKKRLDKLLKFESQCWFDITSFYNELT
jgi:hypothetical protein